MSKKRTFTTSHTKGHTSSKHNESAKDEAENRKFLTIMVLATLALVAALYFLLR